MPGSMGQNLQFNQKSNGGRSFLLSLFRSESQVETVLFVGDARSPVRDFFLFGIPFLLVWHIMSVATFPGVK
jgi:hypothetical protein